MTPPEVFFALVERHVNGPMAEADYTEIGEYDEVTHAARVTPLVAPRWRWLAAQPWFRGTHFSFLHARNSKGPKERTLRVGYEGRNQDGEDDEKWLDYSPGTDELDLTDWRNELEPHADWDLWDNRAVLTTEELERRLRMVGAAMNRDRTTG